MQFLISSLSLLTPLDILEMFDSTKLLSPIHDFLSEMYFVVMSFASCGLWVFQSVELC
jgi:hypothetical protein